jgi:hypothetical protein
LGRFILPENAVEERRKNGKIGRTLSTREK